MSWTEIYRDPEQLREGFTGSPEARYRPVPIWWWSGEELDEQRLLWQLERMAEIGCGAFVVTGLALHGPAVGTVADSPAGFSPPWLALFRRMCERAEELGMSVISWSPLQVGGPAADANRILRERPELRGELIRGPGEPEPFGYDYASADAIAALVGPKTRAGDYLAAVQDLFGGPIVGLFEDEFPLLPAWAPGFAADFQELKGYAFDPAAIYSDVGPRTPALRWDLYDVAATRTERSYTRYLTDLVQRHDLLAGYDEMNRSGDPIISSLAYFDPFRTLSWATAPGTDHMGDARFPMSLATASGAPRVWLEGFHSHGWGMTLDHQMRLLFEWAREGATVFMPHGFYYATRGFWWEWAPPEMGWRQPYARHYPHFADAVGRLMAAMSAGAHVPEVAVLYPTSTIWATTDGHRSQQPEGLAAAATYRALFGVHDTPSSMDPTQAREPSLLAEAGYDRIAVDEAGLAGSTLPLLLPDCICLRTDTVRLLADQAAAGRRVIVVGAVPQWSAETGREDAAFQAEVHRLLAHASTVQDAAAALAMLPPPRVDGLKSQWRRVGELDLVLITGQGTARLRGYADRCPQTWDVRTGRIQTLPAQVDGEDLLLELDGPAAIVALPPGTPVPPTDLAADRVLLLPEIWSCEYLPWGENRWGDYVLPPTPGTPPTQRRTFAFREGDDPAWRHAPVTPEDLEHPFVDLGFEQHMAGATGRPAPAERLLGAGWREVVATYGPKATVNGRPVEYSERLGIEDGALSTQIGLKGKVEPVKVDLGPGGAGEIVSYGYVPEQCRTTLVVEGMGILQLSLDGVQLCGPVELGVLSVPVTLSAGWHELRLTIRAREVLASPINGYVGAPRTRLAWVFSAPYRRDRISIWGGTLVHPDYKAASGPRRFRRRLQVSEPASVSWTAEGGEAISCEFPDRIEAGEHVIEFVTSGGLTTPQFCAEVELVTASARSVVVTDGAWETAGADGKWEGVFPLGSVWSPPADSDAEPVPRRHPLTDVAWLEGAAATAGQVAQLWSDSPQPPPPAWFCFTAGPGAQAMTLPITGEVQAWVDGEPVVIERGAAGPVLPLREHARVALRVQAPAGRRGAACFDQPPVLTLGDGTISTGVSWHRQGLDCFSGVIAHRTQVELAKAASGWLELDGVTGSVRVRVNGVDAGVLAWAPWRLSVQLLAGLNVVELEVANTLGPMTARGVPTPFAPEHQRVSGILGRVRLRLQP